jgi:uncharacterized protein YcaQ
MKQAEARRRWIRAQRLDENAPFGTGNEATRKAVEHLGYVQIDTINVIERCHHHILFNRIPTYQKSDLTKAQTVGKSVFEYWTHAHSYVPTRDYRFFMRAMANYKTNPSQWNEGVTKPEIQKVLRLIQKEGPISIRDIEDDVLVEKEHLWGSRKPSKKALRYLFYSGLLTISERVGMLKKYDLAANHFAWNSKPKPASEKEILDYRIDRALTSQSFVSLDSICHLIPSQKPLVKKALEKRVKTGELTEFSIDGPLKPIAHWIRTEELNSPVPEAHGLTHILSPFDPLIIQRKRLSMVFGYDHLFEAYLPKEKRKYGYFALPVLIGDEIVAAIDLKTDRAAKKMLMQKWTWMKKTKSPERKQKIEEELHRFQKFQLGHE